MQESRKVVQKHGERVQQIDSVLILLLEKVLCASRQVKSRVSVWQLLYVYKYSISLPFFSFNVICYFFFTFLCV